MDAALPWGGHEEPAELPKLAANDRGARGRVDPGGLDQGGGWIGALSTSNAIIAFFFERPAQLLEVVFIHAGVAGLHRIKVDAKPSDMQMFIAVRQDMNAGDARLAGEAEALFLPVGNLQQLCIGKILAVWKPGLRVEKRQRAFGVRLGYLLQGGEGLHRIAAEVFQTACLQQ